VNPDDYADALLKAAQTAMEVVVYRLLLEVQKAKTFPLFLGTADLQALTRELSYEYKTVLKRELENADHVLRTDRSG
jgi:hypothetical protein